jgi:hypothetical protein
MCYFYCWNAHHFDVNKTKPLLQRLYPNSAGINFFVFRAIAFLDLKVVRQRARVFSMFYIAAPRVRLQLAALKGEEPPTIVLNL